MAQPKKAVKQNGAAVAWTKEQKAAKEASISNGTSPSSKARQPGPSSKMDNDFIMTLDSDDEDFIGEEQEAEGEQDDVFVREEKEGQQEQISAEDEDPEQTAQVLGKRKVIPARLADKEKIIDGKSPSDSKRRKLAKEQQSAATAAVDDLDPDFQFDLTGDGYNFQQSAAGDWDMQTSGKAKGAKSLASSGAEVMPLSIDDIILKRREKRNANIPLLINGTGAEDKEEANDSSDEEEEFAGFEEEALQDSEEDDDAEDGFGAGLRQRKKEDSKAAAESDSGEGDSDEENSDSGEEEDPLGSDEDDGASAEGVDDSAASSDEGEDDDDDDEDEEDTVAVKAKKAAFFADEADEQSELRASTQGDQQSSKKKSASDPNSSFQAFELSRPLLRALASLSFHTPTPIQARTIPLALAGRDLVANAVTGSGKTAAFMIPILERLMHLERSGEAKTRVLILTPTRELAIQCQSVGKALAKFTDIRFCLCVGGLSLKTQEAELRLSPEVVIATPGRLIDHVRNTAGFSLDDIEVLVMDEADRMLEEGFNDELTEIVRHCPQATGGNRGRQTMLFSATMTDDVDELVRLSLRKPVRLFVDPKRTTAAKLIQEFVRVRGNSASLKEKREEEEKLRPALLLALCTRTFQNQVIIFVRSKKLAHQLRIIFGLVGLNAVELHGDLSQDQRLQSLQSFKDGRANFLLATDLASRGLDIRGVQTVINYDMPGQFEQYLHRVGRTARAGRNGRAVTLVGEADRKILKLALRKSNPDQVKHRLVPPEVVSQALQTLEELKGDVEEVLIDEKEEKAMRQAEMELKKGENINEHSKEIFSRPARTWFQSEADKVKAKEAGKEENNAKVKAPEKTGKDRFAGLSRRKRRSKMAREEIEKEGKGALKEADAAIRSAKRAQKPTELGLPIPKFEAKSKQKKREKKKRSSASKVSVGKGKSGFGKDLGERKSANSGGSGGGAGRSAKRPGGKGPKAGGKGPQKGKR